MTEALISYDATTMTRHVCRTVQKKVPEAARNILVADSGDPSDFKLQISVTNLISANRMLSIEIAKKIVNINYIAFV